MSRQYACSGKKQLANVPTSLLDKAALKAFTTEQAWIVGTSPVMEAGSMVPGAMLGSGLETSLRRSALGGYSTFGSDYIATGKLATAPQPA
jgi:hypothetical protein